MLSKKSCLWMVLAGVVLAGSPAHALTLGLEGYWKFDGDGSDASSQGRDLTVPAGAGFGTGLLGQAVSTGAAEANAPARPGDDAAFDFGSDDFTIQIWANFASTGGEQILLEKFTGGAGPGWTLTKLSNGTLLFFSDGTGSTSSTGSIGATTGTWHQFIARRSGTDLRLFFDGGSVGFSTLAPTDSITDTTAPLLLGAREGGQDFPLNGSADEVAIWSRALTDLEITTLYNAGDGKAIPEPATFVLLATAALGLRSTGIGRRR